MEGFFLKHKVNFERMPFEKGHLVHNIRSQNLTSLYTLKWFATSQKKNSINIGEKRSEGT